MGQVHDAIEGALADFIRRQHVFFVATAPLAADGLVNASPKGLDSLRILGPRRVAYLDVVGSGAETIAHLRENGRIVVMFCAFEGRPLIVRLHGRGRVIEPQDPDWTECAAHFPEQPGARSIIDVEVERISDSCGYGVPQMQFEAERSQLRTWAERKAPAELDAYRAENNARSLDGLPALRSVTKTD